MSETLKTDDMTALPSYHEVIGVELALKPIISQPSGPSAPILPSTTIHNPNKPKNDNSPPEPHHSFPIAFPRPTNGFNDDYSANRATDKAPLPMERADLTKLPQFWKMYRSADNIPYFVYSHPQTPKFIHSQWEYPTKTSIRRVNYKLLYYLHHGRIPAPDEIWEGVENYRLDADGQPIDDPKRPIDKKVKQEIKIGLQRLKKEKDDAKTNENGNYKNETDDKDKELDPAPAYGLHAGPTSRTEYGNAYSHHYNYDPMGNSNVNHMHHVNANPAGSNQSPKHPKTHHLWEYSEPSDSDSHVVIHFGVKSVQQAVKLAAKATSRSGMTVDDKFIDESQPNNNNNNTKTQNTAKTPQKDQNNKTTNTSTTSTGRNIYISSPLKKGHVSRSAEVLVAESQYWNDSNPLLSHGCVLSDPAIANLNASQFLTPEVTKPAFPESTCCAYPDCNTIFCGDEAVESGPDSAENVRSEMCCSFWLTITMTICIWSTLLGAVLPTWHISSGVINIVLLSVGASCWMSVISWPIIQYCDPCCNSQTAPLSQRDSCTRLSCGRWNEKGGDTEPFYQYKSKQQLLEIIDDQIISSPKLQLRFIAFNSTKRKDTKATSGQYASPSGFIRGIDMNDDKGKDKDTKSRKLTADDIDPNRTVKLQVTVEIPITGYVDVSPTTAATSTALSFHPCSVIEVSFATHFRLAPEQQHAIDQIKNQLIERYREYGQYFEVTEIHILEPADKFAVSLSAVKMEQIGNASHCCSRICCWNRFMGGIFWGGFLNCMFPMYCWFRTVTTGKFNYTVVKAIQLGHFDVESLPHGHF